jgi:hypothetical protein
MLFSFSHKDTTYHRNFLIISRYFHFFFLECQDWYVTHLSIQQPCWTAQSFSLTIWTPLQDVVPASAWIDSSTPRAKSDAAANRPPTSFSRLSPCGGICWVLSLLILSFLICCKDSSIILIFQVFNHLFSLFRHWTLFFPRVRDLVRNTFTSVSHWHLTRIMTPLRSTMNEL